MENSQSDTLQNQDEQEVSTVNSLVEENRLLKEKAAQLVKFIQQVLYDKTGVLFICGEAGEKDQNGMAEYIFVAPTYGVDWHMVYKRVRAEGPGY